MHTESRYKKEEIQEIIFFIAFSIFFIKFMFDSSSLLQIPNIFDTIFITAYLLFIIIKLALQEYNFWQFMIIIAVSAVVTYSCFHAKNNNIYFMSYLCVIAMQNVSLVKVIKLGHALKLITLSIHLPAFVITYILNPESLKFNYRGEVSRTSFFIGHANMFSFLLTWTLFEFIFLNYKKLNIYHLLICWGISIFFYFFTWTNSGMIILTIVTILVIFEKYSPTLFDKTITPVVRYGFSLCTIFNIGIIVFYPNTSGLFKDIWNLLNKFVSGRYLFGAYAYDIYDFTFFGRTINFPQKSFWKNHWLDTIMFDNTYLAYFILFGLVNLLIISVVLFFIGGKMKNSEKIFIIAFIGYGVMEQYVMCAVYCFAFLIMGKYLFDNKEISE